MTPDPCQARALKEMPPSKSQKELQAFFWHHELSKQVFTSKSWSVWAIMQTDIHQDRLDLEQIILGLEQKSKGTHQERCKWNSKSKPPTAFVCLSLSGEDRKQYGKKSSKNTTWVRKIPSLLFNKRSKYHNRPQTSCRNIQERHGNVITMTTNQILTYT